MSKKLESFLKKLKLFKDFIATFNKVNKQLKLTNIDKCLNNNKNKKVTSS